ncbi:MAG: hypothetical protein K0S70_1002 [Microbacterium sp.]|jgi:hypothetical protein|nr:hypothetical protein [Microbacterium sp.]
MTQHTRQKIETANVPRLGSVTAEIGYIVRADGKHDMRMLGKAFYTGTRLEVEDEHREAVAEAFDAFPM